MATKPVVKSVKSVKRVNGADVKTAKAAPPAKAAPARVARKRNAGGAHAETATAAPAAGEAPAAPEAASTVRLSAQQVWQAGLAAFAKAQEEGGRVFSQLVQEGQELHKRRQAMQAGDSAGMPAPDGAAAAAIGQQAAGSWDKLEQVFEERVARALAKMGVPAAQEIAALNRRVDELAGELAALKAASPAGPVVRKRAAAKKPAASGQ